MTGQPTDYARLLRLQRVIKAMRERDLAEARNRTATAERSLEELNRMFDEGGPIVGLFPDLLANYFQTTLSEKADAERQVKASGDELLKEKKKLETIENRYGEQRTSETRRDEAVAQAETLDQRLARQLSASSKIGKIS